MSEDATVESYALGEKCVVPWKDGSCYTGRVQKILDPEREVVTQGVATRKGGKAAMLEDITSLEKLRKDRNQRIPSEVLKESTATKRKWYYVHYFGWKSNYDEWLPIERMLPFTPKNINMMKTVNAEIKERERRAKEEEEHRKPKRKRSVDPTTPPTEEKDEDAKPKKRSKKKPADRGTSPKVEPEAAAAAADASSSSNNTPKKEQHDSTFRKEGEKKPHSNTRKRRVVLEDGPAYEIKLQIPLELKRLLVQDWELVTRDREIVQLPRPVCVQEILQDFVDAHRENASSGSLENLEQFTESMVTYFDYAFGMMLLYRFERNQYYAQKRNVKHFKPSLVYGAEHLARLIVSMPAHLSQMSTMDDITMKYIVDQASALARFMTEHRVRYFAGESTYDSSTRIYQTFAIPNMASGSNNSAVKPEKKEGEDNKTAEVQAEE